MRLSAYPYALVPFACDKCGRTGEYRLARLAAKHGSEIEMPWLLDAIASSCPRRDLRRVNLHDRCEAYFPEINHPRPPDAPKEIERPSLRVVRQSG